MQKVCVLVDLPHGKRAIGTKWVLRNKKDERGIVIRNKARLVTQGHLQEEGIDYEEVFAPIARIEAIRLFLAYASFMGFMVYQIDVKCAFLYGTIEEEVYVYQPPRFEDPDHPDKVYKVGKALYGLHQAPRAWLELIELTVFLLPSDEKVRVEVSAVELQVSAVRLMLLLFMKYALTVNPNIYVSCIKQFWTTVAVKKVNDVIRLQALVDKKKVVVTEATIRLDDAEGVECLPNEEIFCMSTKRTSWNEFSSSMASAVICLSSGRKFNFSKKQVGDLSTHTTKYTSPALTQKVFANIRRVGKGFSRVDTPLFEGMLVEQHVSKEGDADENVENVNAGDDAEGDVSAAHAEVPTIAQALEITKLKRRVQKLETRKKVKVLKLRRLQKVGTTQRVETSDETMLDDVSNQGMMIVEIDQDADVVLEEDKEVADDIKDVQDDIDENAQDQGRKDESKPAEVQEVVYVVTTAKIITEVVTAASKTITAASTTITAAEAQVPAATLTVAPARVTVAPSRRRKGVVIRDPQEESTTSTIIPAETKPKDNDKGILVEEPKPLKKQQQIEQDEKYTRELEAELNKNIDWDEVIDHNVDGFKMDYFKGMSYDDMRPIFEAKFNTNVAFLLNTKEQIEEEESKALKRLNETPAEKAAKRKKLDEEVEELKRHLQIVSNEDDDFHEAHMESSNNDAQDACNADASESSGIFNFTATSKSPPADQMETLTVESAIPTVSSPVPTACLDNSPETSNPELPDRVYNVEKAMYELHLAPRAWYGTLSKYLLDNSFQRALMHDKFQMSAMGEVNFFLGLQVLQKKDGIFLSQDKYVGDILKKFGYSDVRSMIGSFMYLIASRPDIMFDVCACARHQVTPKECHFHAGKRIFRYLKGHPKLGIWYSKESPFELVAYSDSDYGGATQDRKSTTGGCEFLGRRLISWQCKKQRIVATSTTEAEYVAAASSCGQGEGSGTPTKPYHTPSPLTQQSPHHDRSSSLHPTATTKTIPTTTPTEIPTIRQYSKRATRIAQSKALLTAADERASLLRDDCQGEAFPTVSGLEAGQDRENIIKTSALPHDSTPRVTSLNADEGNLEISNLKARIKLLEDKDKGSEELSRDDSPIKGRTEVLTVGVPTVSGLVPTVSAIFTAASVVTPYSRRPREILAKDKGKEKMITRDAEIARIHAEEELKMMIDGLDRNNEVIARHLYEYEQATADLTIGEKIELINELVKYQDHHAKILKYQAQQSKPLSKKEQKEFYMSFLRSHAGWKTKHFKGLKLEKGRAKKIKTFEEVSEEDLKEMMQLVPVEEVYVEALQVKHPIIDWEIHSEGQRDYWKIIKLGGHTTVY
nr:hypothetical protein [Tanacetum cinerariifolium]